MDGTSDGKVVGYIKSTPLGKSRYHVAHLPFKGALYIIQILCQRYTFWYYPAGLTIADPPG